MRSRHKGAAYELKDGAANAKAVEDLSQRRAENFGDGPSFRGFRRHKSGSDKDNSGKGNKVEVPKGDEEGQRGAPDEASA